MMITQQVLEKMQALPQLQQQEVLDFVEFLTTKHAQSASKQQGKMAAAAQALLADYETDTELTSFTTLDSEDFHA